MPQNRRDAPTPRRKLVVSSLLSLVLLAAAVFLLTRRGAEPSRDEAARAGAGDASGAPAPTAAGSAAAKAEVAKAGGAERADEESAKEPEPELPPPLLRGRVTGDGAGIEGAAVHLFSTQAIEKTIERLEGLAPQAGELPDIEAIVAGLREELEKFRSSAITAKSGKEGAYEFRGIEPASYFVLALADGWLFRYGDVVSLSAGRCEVLDMALDRGASISGRVVTASGEGVAGATVTAEFRPAGMAGIGLVIRRLLRYVNGEFLKGPFQTRTSADGSFILTSLPPGVYDVAAGKLEGVEARLPQVETGSTEAVIYLGDPAAVKGAFADAQGSPCAGVPLLLERQDDIVQLQIPIGGLDKIANTVNRFVSGGPKRAVSGAQGDFHAAPLAPGKYRISVECRGYMPFERSFDLDWGQTLDLGLLRLDRGASIAGFVRGAGQRPLEGAKVFATPAKPNFMNMGGLVNDFVTGRISAVTAASGEFRLSGLVKGQYRVTATAAGHGAGSTKSVETDGDPVTIDLKPGVRVVGRVVAARDGKPIAGASVRAREARAKTDGDGRFTLEGVSPKSLEGNIFVGMGGPGMGMNEAEPKTTVDVHANARGWIATEATVDLAAGPSDVEISLEKAPEIAGVVLDPDGKPAPGSLVRLTPAMPDEIPMPFDFFDTGMIFLAAAVTDLEGKFRLAGWNGADEKSRYRVIADHVLYSRGASEPFDLRRKGPSGKAGEGSAGPAGGGPGDLQVTLVRGGSVKGVVTDGTKPVAGATVRLAKAPKKQKGPAEQFGMFLNMLGLPKGGDLAYTNREGRFEYGRVPPGDYVIGAEVAGFTDSPSQPVEIGPGDEREVALTVDPGGEIMGTVSDPAGTALLNARVRLFREPVPKTGGPAGPGSDPGDEEKRFFEAQKLFGGSYKSTRTTEDGSFRFQGLPGGTYGLAAEHPGYVQREVSGVLPDGTAQRLVLEPSAILAGTVADMGSGLPVTRFQVRITREGDESPAAAPFPLWDREQSDAEGRFVRDDLRAGKHAVRIQAPGYAPVTKDVFLAPGARVEERFLLTQAGRVRGTVVDLATQRPIAGARVAVSALPADRAKAEEGKEREGAGDVAARRRERIQKVEERSRWKKTEGLEVSWEEDQRAMGEHFVEEWSGGDSTLSRDDGSFLLEGVPPGPQRVIATHGDYISEARDGVEAAPGQDVEIDFALRPGLSLSGRLRDPAGNASPGRIVFARGAQPENAHVRKSAMAGPGGEFRLGGLEKGTYRLIVPSKSGDPTKLEPVVVELGENQAGLDVTAPD